MGIPPSRIGLFLGFQVGAGPAAAKGSSESPGSATPSSRPSPRGRWPRSSASTRSGRGAGRTGARTRPDPGQGDRRVRLPLDAQSGALRRPGDGRAEFDDRPGRRPALVASRAGRLHDRRDPAARGGEIGALTRLTGDRQAAFTALSQRAAGALRCRSRAPEIVAAERPLMRQRFRGHRSAYRSGPGPGGRELTMARGVIADEPARPARPHLPARRPTGTEVGEYYEPYGGAQARAVESGRRPPGSAGRPAGSRSRPSRPRGCSRSRSGQTDEDPHARRRLQVRALGRPNRSGPSRSRAPAWRVRRADALGASGGLRPLAAPPARTRRWTPRSAVKTPCR